MPMTRHIESCRKRLLIIMSDRPFSDRLGFDWALLTRRRIDRKDDLHRLQVIAAAADRLTAASAALREVEDFVGIAVVGGTIGAIRLDRHETAELILPTVRGVAAPSRRDHHRRV